MHCWMHGRWRLTGPMGLMHGRWLLCGWQSTMRPDALDTRSTIVNEAGQAWQTHLRAPLQHLNVSGNHFYWSQSKLPSEQRYDSDACLLAFAEVRTHNRHAATMFGCIPHNVQQRGVQCPSVPSMNSYSIATKPPGMYVVAGACRTLPPVFERLRRMHPFPPTWPQQFV